MTSTTRLITLEEHFATPDYSKGEGGAFRRDFAESVARRIADIEETRLPEMDATGVDIQVLSLTTPGVQSEKDADLAIERARASNDEIARAIATHPTRFAAFAALPTQSGRAAADELRRSVGELGFVGALVNGHTHGRYLDDPEYEPLWEAVEELDVPLYLHPVFPAEPVAVLSGYPELAGPMWGWGFETASHALRIILGGVFDRHPNANLVLGHMGEGLPFSLSRLDDRYAILEHTRPLAATPSEYIRRNIYITSAGVESAEPLHAAIAALGIDRVLFSIDYPYQSIRTATTFLRSVELTPNDRTKFEGATAARLLRI
jgi:2,3-dihydroxybenzoate decarboxylase